MKHIKSVKSKTHWN